MTFIITAKTFLIPDSTGNHDFLAPDELQGLTPKGVLVFGLDEPNDEEFTGQGNAYSWGGYDGTNQWSMMSGCVEEANQRVWQETNDDHIGRAHGLLSSAYEYLITASSLITNGVRLNVTQAPPGSGENIMTIVFFVRHGYEF